MSCIQITACWTHRKAANVPHTHRLSSLQCTSLNYAYRLPMNSLKWTTNTSKYQRCTPICLFGGKGKSENGSGASPWKALQDVVENLKSKGSSVENLLRQQIEKKEFYDGDGSSGNPPGGGGGGGAGGSGGTEDEGGGFEEALQVFLATIAFLCVYMLIIDGTEVNVIVVDYLGFIFLRKMTARLDRQFEMWKRLYRRLTWRRVVLRDDYWLERQILNTNTWWDGPEKYRRTMSYVASQGKAAGAQSRFDESHETSQQSQYDGDDDDDDVDE